MPVGAHKAPAPSPPWLHPLVVKFPSWPKTRLAWPAEESGESYSSTRLFPESLTYKLSALSSATLTGPHSESAAIRFRLQKLVVKLPAWPKTRSAVVSLVKGVLYSRTRLLVVSATQRLPWLSTATPRGKHRS